MDRDNEALRRRMTGTAGDPAESEESAADETDDKADVVREGVTRAIDPDEIELRGQRGLTEDDTAARVDADIAGFDPDRELARPPDFRESIDVATVAPDGTTVPNGTSQLTDPLTGEAIGGGRSVSDSVKAGLGGLGGDALDRGLDYDPLTPGTQDSRPGGRETTGDPSVDRAISAHDGSQIGMDVEIGPGTVVRPDPVQGEEMEFPIGPRVVKGEEMEFPIGPRVVQGEEMEFPISPPGGGGPPGAAKMEDPDADTGDNVTNLERVTVMQGSRVQPSNNPDDPATGEVSTDNWIPPEDLVSRPAQEGEVEATTLTSAATLGSSPVTNPTDPVLGDDGIIHGGSYGGSGGSGGGGEIMPTGMSAGDASALGGEDDINDVSVDMATGQVVGSAAPGEDAASAIGAADATLGGESLGAPGGIEGPPAMGEEPPPDGDDG